MNPSPNEKLNVRLVRSANGQRDTSYLIASRMIEGYQGLEEMAVDQGKRVVKEQKTGCAVVDGKPVTGINKHFILRYLLGDFDVVNMQNLGLVQKNGHYEARSIDFGKAFCKPETALFHSAVGLDRPPFIDVIADPKAPSWVYCFTNLVTKGSNPSGEVQGRAAARIREMFKDCTLEGSGRDQPHLPKAPDVVYYMLPEAVANPTEVLQTLKHLAGTDMRKLAEMAEPYEEAIVDYIQKNKLDIPYEKGKILGVIQERLSQIKEKTQAWEQDGLPGTLEGAVDGKWTIQHPPALHNGQNHGNVRG